jgi:hypothetical protein
MKLLMAMAAGLVGYCYYNGRCARDAGTRKVKLRDEVNRWEGEGGNVPTVATPSPAPVPRTSYPDSGSPLRH